ncbi:MAG TPA: hypothetical protein VMS94_02485 [Acidobacteriota bacterium]|nr:hypothetical protein [Acidobacteriota bacterium]
MRTVSRIALTLLVITITVFHFAIQPVRSQQVIVGVSFENGTNVVTKVAGNVFTVGISISNSPDIDSWVLEIQWDPVWLELQTGTINDVVEGDFMKSHGNTSFVVQEPNNTAGVLPHIECALQPNESASGSGFLCFINFRATAGNDCVGIAILTIADPNGRSYLSMKSNQVLIDATVNGTVSIIAGPPPELPMAEFTPAQGIHFNVGDNITLNGSTSTGGVDILPYLNPCPITEWRWDIDVGDDGLVDLTLYGEVQSFVANDSYPIAITLTVTAPDPIPPTSHYYYPTDNETHVITAITSSKFGDIGGGTPPQFYYFDGVVNSRDLNLFLQCYKSIAPPECMYLADLGSRVDGSNVFFAYDDLVTSTDLSLFLLCYKGLGP